MTFKIFGAGVLLFVALPLAAHHSLAAHYDDAKKVTLKGVVTKFDWANPHVFVYLDAETAGTTENWAVEMDSRPEMKRAGWTHDSVQVGDLITVEGGTSRDGLKAVHGLSVMLASGKKLPGMAPALTITKSNQAVPKWPDGHPRLGPAPGQTGYWANPSVGALTETSANVRVNREGLLANINDAPKAAPFLPWAKGLFVYRQKTLLKDDPMGSCLPPGGPRQFMTANGIQIVEQPERKRIFIMSGGGDRNWRLINTDGRALPSSEDEQGTYYGHSVGKWEGDTLVIDSTAYNERFWLTNGGLPHTESLKLHERISRPDFNTLKYEVTVTDPGAYSRPWTGGWTLNWIAGQEIEEYFCDDNNRDQETAGAKHP